MLGLRAHLQLTHRTLALDTRVRVERVEREQHVVDVGHRIEVARHRIGLVPTGFPGQPLTRADRAHHVEVRRRGGGTQADAEHDDARRPHLISHTAGPADRLDRALPGLIDPFLAAQVDAFGIRLGHVACGEVDLAVGEPCDGLAALAALAVLRASGQGLACPVQGYPVIGVDAGVLGLQAAQLLRQFTGVGVGEAGPVVFRGVGVGEAGRGDLKIGIHPPDIAPEGLQQIAGGLHTSALWVALLQAARLVEQQQQVTGLLRGQTCTEPLRPGCRFLGRRGGQRQSRQHGRQPGQHNQGHRGDDAHKSPVQSPRHPSRACPPIVRSARPRRRCR
nr:hypothetical protein CPGR_02354 [Mycolicibacterium fortuitum subsp. fortuitum DSM 46621 = ATCC 6841 = JCM 6387]